jgi:hypothetical protein
MNGQTTRLRVVVAIAVLASVTIIAVAAPGRSAASSASANGSSVPAPTDIVATVRSQFDDQMISEASVSGSTVNVDLNADSGPSGAIALWDGMLAAQAVSIDRVANGEAPVTTATFTSSQDGAVLGGGAETVAAPVLAADLPSGTCEDLSSKDAPVGATVTGLTLALAGGACVVTVQPSDAAAYVADAGENLASLLSAIPSVQTHPYLVEVVDSRGDTEMVSGWIPGSQPGSGQGLSWVEPGLSSDALSSGSQATS